MRGCAFIDDEGHKRILLRDGLRVMRLEQRPRTDRPRRPGAHDRNGHPSVAGMLQLLQGYDVS